MRNCVHELDVKKEQELLKSNEIDGVCYQIYGFGLEFQMWIYVAIPSIASECAKALRHVVPTVLKWSSPSLAEFGNIQAIIDHPTQVRLNTLVSTNGLQPIDTLLPHVPEVLFDAV